MITASIALTVILSNEAKADQFDDIRHKWANFLIGENSSATDPDVLRSIKARDAEASQYWLKLHPDSAGRARLWDELSYTYSKDITTSYRRLAAMALAYQTPHGSLYHHIKLKAAIIMALQWLYNHHYNEHIPLPVPAEGSDIHNWWDYKIGTPLELNTAVILLYDELTTAQREAYIQAIDHFTPDFADRYTRKPATVQFTAANRVWVSTVIALRGIIIKDADRIKMASDSLAPVFKDSESGDGFYKDGSYIQHVKHPYTGGYGISLLNRLAEEIYLLSGSAWAVKPDCLQHLYGWIFNAFAPIIYKGNVMSMVEGREISRPDAQGDRKGALVMQAIALLMQSAAAHEAAELRGLVNFWFKDYVVKNAFFARIPANYIPIVKKLQTHQQTDVMPQAYLYRQFASMDRAVQQTPAYAFGISMHSARIFNYETRTGYENIKGWHTSDGQTYLYNDDTGQFNDDFWATVNYYHLPGTTVEEQTPIPGFKNSRQSWVGGTSLVNRYGVTGMDLAPAGQTLKARKSWFMLDGKIVALGAGIVNQDNAEVATYIEQRKLTATDNNVFIINGQNILKRADTGNKPVVVENARWAHLSGATTGAAIGYYFPEPTRLYATRLLQSGSWHDVNVNYSNKVITHPYLTLWKKHGVYSTDSNSEHNTYAYVLLPGFTPEATEKYAAHPDIRILANTAGLQAVKSDKLQLLAANFWQHTAAFVNESHQPEYLQCDGPAAVMVMKAADSLHIAVADPTQNNNVLYLTLKETANKVMTADSAIQVISLTPVIRLRVNVKGLAGRTSTIVLKVH